MPLSKVKQAEYMRRYRAGVIPSVIPKATQSVTSSVIPNPPLYNPSLHRAGDTVRVLRGKREVTVVIPKLDADGNVIPDYN